MLHAKNSSGDLKNCHIAIENENDKNDNTVSVVPKKCKPLNSNCKGALSDYVLFVA